MPSPWVRQCTFSFQCPLSWDGLSRTSDERVRHCSECGRDVFLTKNEEELKANAFLRRCVAVESAGTMFLGEVNPPYLDPPLSLTVLPGELLHKPD